MIEAEQKQEVETQEAEDQEIDLEVEESEDEGDVLDETIQTQEQKKQFDPKTDKVEFNTPEQQEKFNYVYKQVKMSDARNAMLNDLLQKQNQRLEELESRLSKTDKAEAELILVNKIKQAKESGDEDAEIKAIKEYASFVSKSDTKEPDQQKYQKPPIETYAVEEYIENFQQERDEVGNYVRPWLFEGNPEFNNAIELLENTIVPKYLNDPMGLPKALSELDKLMKAKTMTKKPPSQPPQHQNTRAPNPMQGGNLTNAKQKPTIKMTRQEMDIAKKLGVDPKRYAAKRDALKGKK